MTCKQVLLDYINSHEGWHKKVHLYTIAEDWSPESAGRALRELKEEGKIQVGYYDGKYAKNLAKYAKKDYTPPKVRYIEVDGIMKAVINN
jgi:ribosomal protein L7Ae-like RNA K-turn-binding protein